MATSRKKKQNPHEHIAVEMYSKRVEGDTKKGKADIYERNPDARVLYFKGVHDTLVCMRIWANHANSDALAEMLAAMELQTHDQTNH